MNGKNRKALQSTNRRSEANIESSQSDFIVVLVGLFVIALAILGGFGIIRVEDSLAHIFTIDVRVLTSTTFAVERWLFIAVFVTAIYSLIFYVFFMMENARLLREVPKEFYGRFVAASVFFPIFNIISLGTTFWFVRTYCAGPGNIASLKFATATLLFSYIVNDLLAIGLGRLHTSGKRLLHEGKEALVRLDLPVFIAFSVLMGFTELTDIKSKVSSDVVNAFSSGAAAFKLILTVIMFTVISIQGYLHNFSSKNTES